MNQNTLLPIAYIERRMTRHLWKIVHLGESGWLVPTKHLIASIMMGGKIGYPAELYISAGKLAKAGLRVKNRIIYENPRQLISSMYGVSLNSFDIIAHELDKLNLLHLYEESFDEVSFSSDTGFDSNRILQEYKESADFDVDLMDKYSADMLEARLDMQRFPQLLGAVIQSSLRDNAFPLTLQPTPCINELKRLNNPFYLLVKFEHELISRLPDQILSFQELSECSICNSTNVLREALLRISSGKLDNSESLWDEALIFCYEFISNIGIPYQDFIMGEAIDLPKNPKLGDEDGFYIQKMSEVWETINQDALINLHKVLTMRKVLEQTIDKVELLFIFSKATGISIASIADFMRVAGGYKFQSSDIIGGRVQVY